MTFMSERMTGWFQIRRLIKPNTLSMTCGETRWFATAGHEFGLWYVTLHGFGLHFGIIGPFGMKRQAAR